MAITAKQGQCLAYLFPSIAILAAIGVTVRPALMQAKQQVGNAEQSRQMTAIGQDIIAGRCYSIASGKAPIKGELMNISPASLSSSCVYGAGWYGFLAVLDNQTTVIDVYTQVQLKNTLSTLKGK